MELMSLRGTGQENVLSFFDFSDTSGCNVAADDISVKPVVIFEF
jgi:hypothetical protein